MLMPNSTNDLMQIMISILKNDTAEKIVFNFHSLNEIFCLMLLPKGSLCIKKANVKAENNVFGFNFVICVSRSCISLSFF